MSGNSDKKAVLDISASAARTGLMTAEVAPRLVAAGVGAIAAGSFADRIVAYAPKAVPYLRPLAIGATALSLGVGAGVGAYEGYQRQGVKGAAKGALRGAADALTLGFASKAYAAIPDGTGQKIADGARAMITAFSPGSGRPDGGALNSPASAATTFNSTGSNVTEALDAWSRNKNPQQVGDADGNSAGMWQPPSPLLAGLQTAPQPNGSMRYGDNDRRSANVEDKRGEITNPSAAEMMQMSPAELRKTMEVWKQQIRDGEARGSKITSGQKKFLDSRRRDLAKAEKELAEFDKPKTVNSDNVGKEFGDISRHYQRAISPAAGNQQSRPSSGEMQRFKAANRAYEDAHMQSHGAEENGPPEYGINGNGMRGFQIPKVQAAAQRAKGNNYTGPEE